MRRVLTVGAVRGVACGCAAVALASCSGSEDPNDTQFNAMGTGGVYVAPSFGGTHPTMGGRIGGGGFVPIPGGGSISNPGLGGALVGAGGFGNGGVIGGGGTVGAGGAVPCTDNPPPNGDTCQHAVEYGWCGQPWMNGACARSCSLCTDGSGSGGAFSSGGSAGNGGAFSSGGSVGNGGAPSSGGAQGMGGYTPLPGGRNGWASRYWDCCKPACGWDDNVSRGSAMSSCSEQNQSLGSNHNGTNSCQGGPAFMCWSGAPWSVSPTLSYGFAAAAGGNYQCGRCYQLQFTGTGHSGNNPGAASLQGKTMIVQIINNGGVGGEQFDLLIPGGGVGDFPSGCTRQWGTSDLGERYGGFLAACNGNRSCVQQKCNTIFANKPELLAGCNWFLGWFNAADNPNLQFRQVACPSEIVQRSGLQDSG